ncbi:hypothetical protein CMEL01_00548 [Colletotrichum melonis]|uniref:Uncharacterized protein n=1 Tax=Colletotrichum melonis TaxID=1209925 RepID=A0AAI9V1C6_9PEZI|nr:hypothetical protein CMEL01_00548 [Colletotrichum melonis]
MQPVNPICRPNFSCPVGPLHTNNDAYREGSTCWPFTPTFVIGFAGHFPEQTSPEGIIRCCTHTTGTEKEYAAYDVRRATCLCRKRGEPGSTAQTSLVLSLFSFWLLVPSSASLACCLLLFLILNGMSNPNSPPQTSPPCSTCSPAINSVHVSPGCRRIKTVKIISPPAVRCNSLFGFDSPPTDGRDEMKRNYPFATGYP